MENKRLEQTRFIVDSSKFYKKHELDLDKINSVEDCKRILKFLCDLVMMPIQEDYEYNGFEEVKEYFK